MVLHSYGKDVHAHLAAQDTSSQLFGISHLEDFAIEVVMELLKDGRMTLFDYCENRYWDSGIPDGPRSLHLQRLEDILDCLDSKRMVHGWRTSC